jgi:hypothetical protein
VGVGVGAEKDYFVLFFVEQDCSPFVSWTRCGIVWDGWENIVFSIWVDAIFFPRYDEKSHRTKKNAFFFWKKTGNVCKTLFTTTRIERIQKQHKNEYEHTSFNLGYCWGGDT